MLLSPILTAYIEQDTVGCLKAIRASEQHLLSYCNSHRAEESPQYYGEIMADLCNTLHYISQQNPTLAGLFQARRAQIESFNKALTYSGNLKEQWNKIEEKLSNLLKVVLGGVVELNAVGQVLFYVKLIFEKDKDAINSTIEVVKVPQKYYCRTQDNGFFLLPNTQWAATHKGSSIENYIYMQDENMLTGGIMLTLIKYVVAKDSNLNSWYEGNNKLFGSLVAFYDVEKLIEQVKLTSPEAMAEEVNSNIAEGLRGIAQALADSRKLGSAVLPNAVTLQKQDFVEANIAQSFKHFVEKIDSICEIAILGQAGTTRDTQAGSFAKAKAMQVTTDNIRDADIQVAKTLVNKCLQAVLPLLTSAIKAEEVKLEFIYDDNVDVLTFVNAIRAINDMNVKTDRGNLFRVGVAELYRKLDIALSKSIYDADEVFEFGDKFGQALVNELASTPPQVADLI